MMYVGIKVWIHKAYYEYVLFYFYHKLLLIHGLNKQLYYVWIIYNYLLLLVNKYYYKSQEIVKPE